MQPIPIASADVVLAFLGPKARQFPAVVVSKRCHLACGHPPELLHTCHNIKQYGHHL